MSDMTRDDVPWQERANRLIDRMAKNCTGCPYKGGRCSACDCATAVGIAKDRDAEAATRAADAPEKKMKPAVRRARVAAHMDGRGWLRPADIRWPIPTPPNIRTMDLAALVESGVLERRKPDPGNARVFVYRRAGE